MAMEKIRLFIVVSILCLAITSSPSFAGPSLTYRDTQTEGNAGMEIRQDDETNAVVFPVLVNMIRVLR